MFDANSEAEPTIAHGVDPARCLSTLRQLSMPFACGYEVSMAVSVGVTEGRLRPRMDALRRHLATTSTEPSTAPSRAECATVGHNPLMIAMPACVRPPGLSTSKARRRTAAAGCPQSVPHARTAPATGPPSSSPVPADYYGHTVQAACWCS